jgi:hypothetical protein
MNVNVREAHANSLLASLQWLRCPNLLRREGKFDLAQLAEDYDEAVNRVSALELWFVYTAPKSLILAA